MFIYDACFIHEFMHELTADICHCANNKMSNCQIDLER